MALIIKNLNYIKTEIANSKTSRFNADLFMNLKPVEVNEQVIKNKQEKSTRKSYDVIVAMLIFCICIAVQMVMTTLIQQQFNRYV